MPRIGPSKLHSLLEALVSIKIGDAHRPGISGFAACYAGWLRLPGPPPPNIQAPSHRAGGSASGAVRRRENGRFPPEGRSPSAKRSGGAAAFSHLEQ